MSATETDNGAATSGFDTGFLPFTVALPLADQAVIDDVALADGESVLDYAHFSLTMSRSRKLARWVAWNIDGSTRFDDIPRDDQWFKPDRRLPEDAQTLNDVYDRNRLDRGHLARRADLLWGSRDEADQANRDSFYFTNITPQMDTFNQAQRFGVWGRLENALLEVVDGRRASVLAGPVLAVDDPPYRGVQVPREFWKVLVYALDGRPRLRAFLVTQSLVLSVLPDPLTEFETFAITLAELHERTGLQLSPELAAHEVREPSGAHDVWGRPPIRRATAIYW